MGNELGDSGAGRLARYAQLSAYHPFPRASDLSHDPRLQLPGQRAERHPGPEGEVNGTQRVLSANRPSDQAKSCGLFRKRKGHQIHGSIGNFT